MSAGMKPRIAVVGGGFAGASVALHIHRLAPQQAELIVFEPRSDIGRGVAYSSRDNVHRTNVPTVRMRLFPGDPNHFDRWYASSPESISDSASKAKTGGIYPPRHVFGSYLAEQVKAIGSSLTHVQEKIVAIDADGSRFALKSASGQVVLADMVILALSSIGPNSQIYSRVAPGVRQSVVWNPWDNDAYDNIARHDDVLIVGSGLTMADIVASLDRRGHLGKIVVVSRRGLRPQSQARSRVEPFGEFLLPPSRGARTLLARIRKTVALAEKLGLTWQSVLDQVHDHGNQIWHFLSWEERGRLMRYAWPYWNCFRFRIAPQLDELLVRKMSDGQLSMQAASIEQITDGERGLLHVRMRKRGAATPETFRGRVAIAAGTIPGYLLSHDPLIKSLCDRGLVRPDPLRVGLDMDLSGRAFDRQGNVQRGLFVVGTLAQGMFGDQVGAADISSHALRVADEVVKGLPELIRRKVRFDGAAY